MLLQTRNEVAISHHWMHTMANSVRVDLFSSDCIALWWVLINVKRNVDKLKMNFSFFAFQAINSSLVIVFKTLFCLALRLHFGKSYFIWKTVSELMHRQRLERKTNIRKCCSDIHLSVKSDFVSENFLLAMVKIIKLIIYWSPGLCVGKLIGNEKFDATREWNKLHMRHWLEMTSGSQRTARSFDRSCHYRNC